ncbi:MAG: response regulator [Fusobacteriota bacterium]
MKKILIVDDSLFARENLKKAIPKDQVEIIGEASRADDAISMAKKLQPDIITLDIAMPGMTGISALEELQKVSPNSDIIMCSAMGQEPLIKEALDAGAEDFIIKPFSKEEVMEVINDFLI